MNNQHREKITALQQEGFGYTTIAIAVGLTKDKVKEVSLYDE